jgi:hypothetical protein
LKSQTRKCTTGGDNLKKKLKGMGRYFRKRFPGQRCASQAAVGVAQAELPEGENGGGGQGEPGGAIRAGEGGDEGQDRWRAATARKVGTGGPSNAELPRPPHRQDGGQLAEVLCTQGGPGERDD